MAGFIERTALMERFAQVVAQSNNSDFQKAPTWNDAVEIVENFPTADVRPVVRGRWIPFTSEAAGDIWYCSACGIGFAHHMDFCPHCGADLRTNEKE